MTEENNAPTLFFVKNTTHQIGPVEKFLKKRGYNVIVEVDIPIAINHILKINPDYIFLAWDHKNENIRQMPKTIYQSCTGQVVPFIMSTQRDQIIQIESSNFESKLYPPLSGPAIIRAISKYEKKNQAFQNSDKKAVTAKKDSGMIQVKSFFKDENNEGPEVHLNKTNLRDEGDQQMIASHSRMRAHMFMPKQNQQISNAKKHALSHPNIKQKLELTIQNGLKNKMMIALEDELNKYNQLTSEQKALTKKNTLNSIEPLLDQDEIDTKSLENIIEEEITKLSDLQQDEQTKSKDKLVEIFNEELSNILKQTESNSKTNDMTDEVMSEMLSHEIKKLTKEQIDSLDKSFDEIIKPDLIEVVEANAEVESQRSDITQTTQVYVLTVQEPEWTGYLCVASESYLDLASAQDILNNWMKVMVKTEENESSAEKFHEALIMEIRTSPVDFSDFCLKRSDFFKQIEYKNKKTMLGFFSFSPYHVINAVHLTHDMLELPTEFLQPKKELSFDVNLYLQENKKFITYIRAGSFFEEKQLERLIVRKAKYIFSHMEYEIPLLKYKAEFNIKFLIDDYNKKKGPKE